MEFLIVSGLSGGGKSRAADVLEDLDFYCVDNMPTALLTKFAELCLATRGRYEKVALVTDIRSQESFSELFAALGELKSMGVHYRILFVEASESAIVRRYKESRRPHPLQAESGCSLPEAVRRESELLGALCHRRVREYPITGGPSTCCESFYDEKMIDEAYELLKSFHFTGLAMVEFKGDCILEVNPRVWGSFPMTEAAQSPIVAHYAQAAQGGQVTYTAKDYRTGVKMRFFLNDTVAALSYLKAGRVKEGLRGLGDFFTAKEALSAKGDGKVMRAYLKKSLFER